MLWLIALVLIGVGVFLAAISLRKDEPSPSLSDVERITEEELAERYGIRVTLVGVTAGGGMVDFRFEVLDAEKARQINAQPENLPVLIVPETDTYIPAPPEMLRNMELQEGLVYYILYGNPGGLIRPGTVVSVMFIDVILEGLVAQ